MKNCIITQEEVFCEKFNSDENRIKLDGSVAQYLNYYMAILALACSLGIISKDESENIFKLFFTSIKQKSSNKIYITNMLYIFSAWLQSMPQWDAFKVLSSIKDLDTADAVLEKAKKWLRKQIVKLKVNLLAFNKTIAKLENPNFTKVYMRLLKFIDALDPDKTTVCYKSEHTSMQFFLLFEYDFLGDDQKYKNPRISLMERINLMISDFIFEMRILLKLNAKELIAFVEKDFNNTMSEKYSKLEEINEKYQKQIDMLKEKKRRKLNTKGSDYIKITSFYKNEIDKVYDEWEEAERKYTEELDEQNPAEEILDFMSETPNLRFVMNEFTLYSLAKNGEIEYPRSRSEKAEMFEQLSVKKVVSEVLEYASSIGLSPSEITYLQNKVIM